MAAADPLHYGTRDARAHDDQRSVGELFSELTDETRTLIRQEVELAKTELTQKAQVVAKDAGMMAAGGVLAYAGFFFVLAAVTIGVGHLIGYGWSALVVGLVLIGLGAFMAMNAKKDLQQTTLAPERTQHNVKETKQWLKQQTR